MIAKTKVDDAISHKPTDLGGSIGRNSAPDSEEFGWLVEKNRFSTESKSFRPFHEAEREGEEEKLFLNEIKNGDAGFRASKEETEMDLATLWDHSVLDHRKEV